MMPAPELSDSGALDYGLGQSGCDDIYTLRFDGATQFALPVSSAVADGDEYLTVARQAVEALASVHLKNWSNADNPELDFPLFAVWALAMDGTSILINNRPADAPPPPAANW